MRVFFVILVCKLLHFIGKLIGKGSRRFIIGIGGSATNDGGIGMLQALGFGLNSKVKSVGILSVFSLCILFKNWFSIGLPDSHSCGCFADLRAH